LNDAFKVAQNIVVPKAQHAISVAFQIGSSADVSNAISMLPAIHLDDQTRLMTHKVGDEMSDRLLATKFGTS